MVLSLVIEFVGTSQISSPWKAVLGRVLGHAAMCSTLSNERYGVAYEMGASCKLQPSIGSVLQQGNRESFEMWASLTGTPRYDATVGQSSFRHGVSQGIPSQAP